MGVFCQSSMAKKRRTRAKDTHRKVDRHKVTHEACASATSCGAALECMMIKHSASYMGEVAPKTQPCLAQFQPDSFPCFAWQCNRLTGH